MPDRVGRVRHFLGTAVRLGVCLYAVTSAAGAASDPLPKTEVIFIGTLHEFHDQCPRYTRDHLRDLIIGVHPSAILYEMPPEMDGVPTSAGGRIHSRFRDNESVAANQAADSLGVVVVPYDREGRNEFYVKTRYFEREEFAFGELMKLSEKCAAEPDPNALAIATNGLFASIQQAQMELVSRADPGVINSPAFDELSANKRQLVYGLWPSLLSESGLDTVISDLRFFEEEWNDRNRIMAENISRISEDYPGGRLVVLCGAEHRHDLRALLEANERLTVAEYYEVDNGGAVRAHLADR
jgi:hypothetical protein